MINKKTVCRNCRNKKLLRLFSLGNLAYSGKFPKLKKIEPWPIEKELKYEKELLGFYLSNNPLAKHEEDFIELSTLDSNGYNKFNSEFTIIN